jgi:hypothetical protein
MSPLAWLRNRLDRHQRETAPWTAGQLTTLRRHVQRARRAHLINRYQGTATYAARHTKES